MYIIIAYDIQVDRIDEVRKYLKRYLNWIQNSLFEGEVTLSELEEIKRNNLNLLYYQNRFTNITYNFSGITK